MKLFIKTLGCEKNTWDSDYAAGIMNAAGVEIAENPDDADFLIVNTCGFINDAKKQSIEAIFELAGAKKPGQKLIVTGCLSQRYSKELADEIPEVDYFFGVNNYASLPDLLTSDIGRINVSPYPRKFEELGKRYVPDLSYTASIKIAEGCNNICSYCIIPFIRGRYRSRMPEDIIREAELLAENGCKELVIIAQDVTAYGCDLNKDNMLADLLRNLCKINGIEWIRLMYCYEDEISDELIEVIKSEPKICKYLDIPIQHCSDKILKSMNRASTKSSIKLTINKLRKQIPDIVIRTTLITGYPGESKDDFDELYEFVSEMKFDRLGVFAYSKEEGTAAAKMKPQVRQDVKERRRDKIMELQRAISLENNQKYIGKTISVIIEEQDDDTSYIGRASFDAPEIDNGVIISSAKKLYPGDIVSVQVTDAFDYDLCGEIVL